MMGDYSITIVDKDGKQIGKLPTASPTDIISLINKGFVVINNYTGTPIDISDVQSVIGVSECIIGE